MPHTGIMYRLIAISAVIVIAGIILSGPPAVYFISLIESQPEWVDLETFQESYHPVQNLAWAGGFLFILGMAFFISSAYQLAVSPSQKVPGLLAIVFVTVFAVLIGVNYALQIAWIPVLAGQKNEALSLVTMSNTQSVAWVLEMFGYGFLGLSTWCISMVFWGSKRMNWIRYLLIAYGVISVAGAATTIGGVSWLSKATGTIAFTGQNVLLLITMVLIYHEFRKRRIKGGR
ncbi:MAG: hypothetical protein K9H65_06355 [Bacteroidales bacterium]|nr:hypothetical protein [Bacteroidales bacterium]